MALGQILSLPSAATGLAPVSSASAWAFGSSVTASASLPVGIGIIGLQFQNTDIPALDVNQNILFEITVGGVTKLQIPFNIKADTLVGYGFASTSSIQAFYLPEPYLIPSGSAVAVKVADSIAAALTYHGVKLLYVELRVLASRSVVGDRYWASLDTGGTISIVEITQAQFNDTTQINTGGSTLISVSKRLFFDTISGNMANDQYATQANGYHWVKIAGYEVIKIAPGFISGGVLSAAGTNEIINTAGPE